MSKVRVGILAKVFVEWSGGVDFITYIANAIAANPNFEPVFFVPDTNDALNFEDEASTAYTRWQRLAHRARAQKPQSQSNPAKPLLTNLSGRVRIVYYRNTHVGLYSALAKSRIDIVLPTTNSLSSSFPWPWVGYIWDFQHKHLPEYFSKDEIKGRQVAFRATLTDAPAVIVNSEQAKADIVHYFPELAKRRRVYSLPFCPSLDPAWLAIDGDTMVSKYRLPRPYFIVCNQFWVHKSHLTAIRAFAELHKSNPGIDLVCTGKMEEPRIPDYIDSLRREIKQLGLTKSVHLLGYIPKNDQIGLLKRSIALVQPTLYEGGPGGGAAYNAAALGIPIIASDIPVNKEIKEGIRFFKAGSAPALVKQMTAQLHAQAAPPTAKALQRKSDRNLQRLSRVLTTVIETTLNRQNHVN